MRAYIFIVIVFFTTVLTGQTIEDVLDQTSREGVIEMVQELSGEKDITFNGRTSTIPHRVSQRDNDLAADYISQKLNSYGLPVENIVYRQGGRNVVATQIGKINPNNIYIISGHYDTVVEGGADDNASGTAAVLEAARILSQYNLENTIKYALWDEEEIGLIGSRDYAQKALANNENIIAVLNIDMIGYDSNQNKLFDIDVRNVNESQKIATDLLNIVKNYNLDLVANLVNPGTPASDHGPFWDVGYSAVLLGEGWSEDDVTPGYHNTDDRFGLFNPDYFYNLVKLVVAYTAEKGVLLNSVSTSFINQIPYSIYPNPASQNITIDLEESLKGRIEIISIDGAVLKTQLFQGAQISLDLDTLTSGVHILKIIGNDGLISYGKIVLE